MKKTEETKAMNLNGVQLTICLDDIEEKMYDPMVWLMYKILLEVEGGVV